MSEKRKRRKTIGKVIADLLRERTMTAYALAKRAALNLPTLSAILRQTKQPMFETVRKLAAAMDVSLDEIASRLPPIELGEPARPTRGRPRKESE
jgi:transcriptional regulator with XRE-family HTH domain